MAFSVTNNFAGTTTLAAADLDQNFTDIENELNGGLTNANLSATAGITNDKLATSEYEVVVNMGFHVQDTAGAWVAGSADSTPGASPTGDGTILALAGLPTDQAVTYAIKQVDYIYKDTSGTVNGSFDITFGYYDGASAWQITTAVKNNITITAATSESAKVTSPTVPAAATANQNFLAIQLNTKGTGLFTALNDFLYVSVKLTASLRT